MIENPKDVDFIENTVEGGLDFKSTEVFIKEVRRYI